MGKCKAFTKKFRPCRGHAGPYRLCHVHERWYIDNLWLPYILAHIDPYSKFDYITQILSDPFATYFPQGSIGSLEEYFDILYETGPPQTKYKVNLLYQIACRSRRIKPSLAPNLWNHNIDVHVPIIMTYYRSYYINLHSDRFKYIVQDVIGPYLYNENFEHLIKYIGVLLKYKYDSSACVYLINITFDTNWNSYKLYDNETIVLNESAKYLTSIKSEHITNGELEALQNNANKVFAYLRANISYYKKYLVARCPVFEEELLQIIYHPDNVKRLVGFET